MKKISAKKLRVLQLTSAPAMGGIENQILYFLQRYDRERFIVDVACGRSTEGALSDKFLETDTKLILCRWSSYVVPFVWRLLRLLRRERYDVVHARLSEVSGAAMLAARLAGVPIRIASYEHTKTRWRNPGILNHLAVGVLQWMTSRWATTIIGDAEVCLDTYHPNWRQHPEQYQICYDGIDIERFSGTVVSSEVRRELGLPVDSLVVGYVSRFAEVKNHQTFVDVAGRVSKHFGNVYFLLVGDGTLRPQIETEVANRGLRNRFVFTGTRHDVPRMLATMDVFVMPSLDEGFGLAVAEAQMCGLPVVASDIPGIREALCPSMHKFCRHSLDSAGMAEQVISLLEDPELRNKLGSEAREYVSSRFSMNRTVKQLESVYHSGSAG
jgi:glycosyltransferase involved in cell wall biosynthesis